MDSFHRKAQHQDTRMGRDCQFCKRSDPEFGRRDPLDRMVFSELNHTAAGHITENGHSRHRMLEIKIRLLAKEFGIQPNVA